MAQKNGGSKKSSRSVLLGEGGVKWLEDQITAFKVADSGKAFRCCVNWACQTGKVLTGTTPANDSILVSATAEQWAWLDQYQTETFNAPASLIALARTADPAEIFAVIRCKSRTKAKGVSESNLVWPLYIATSQRGTHLVTFYLCSLP